MIQRITYIFIGVGFFLPFCICGQPKDPLLTKEQMTQDLDTLLKILESSHPFPKGYAEPMEWNLAVQSAYDSCMLRSRNNFEFSLILGKLLQTMKDSHTQVSINGLWNQHLDKGYRFVPIKTLGNWVCKDLNQKLKLGSELIAIEGITLEKIIMETSPLLLLEHDSFDGIRRQKDELLPVYSALLLIQDQDSVDIQYKDALGIVHEIRYPTWGKKEKEQYQNRNADLYNDLPKIEFHHDTAYIGISSFAPRNMTKQNRMIQQFFKSCQRRKINHLVVDLRDNTGGKSTEVEYLMSFLLEEGYNAPHNIIAKRSGLSDSRVKPLKNNFIRGFLKFTMRRNEDIQRYIDLMSLPEGETDTLYFTKKIKQKKWVFHGEKNLWVNGLSASASVDFTQAWKEHELGKIWGQCIMGNQIGTFGNAAVFELPQSKINVSIATIRYNYRNEFEFHSPNLCPEIRIEYSLENIIKGTDAYWSAYRKKI